MKVVRTAMFAFAILFAVNVISTSVSYAQTGRRTTITLSNTTLEARRNSGDFTEWGLFTDISSPHAVTFRWGSKQPNAAKAYYQVSEENLFMDMSQEAMLKAIRRGDLGKPPAVGSVAQFDIDFAAFAPANAPASPKSYFIRVITVDDLGHLVGVPSRAVRVDYSSPNAPVKFDDTNRKPRPDVPRPYKH